MSTDPQMIREAVAVFHDSKSLDAAIFDLETHGFDRSELSLLAPVSVVEKELGHVFQSVADLEDDVYAPMVAYTSPESVAEAEGALAGGLLYVGALAGLIPVVASGGSVAAALLAMSVAGGMGASIGALLAGVLGRTQAHQLEEQLERGGLLLWVRTWNKGDEKRAVEILSAHSADDVHVHSVPETDSDLDALMEKAGPTSGKYAYRGVNYISTDKGVFYTAGHVFPTEAALKAFIDRGKTIESHFDNILPDGVSLAEALTDPARAFGALDNLVNADLPASLKAELLKRWSYDVKQQQRATTEGMPAADHCVPLGDIQKALSDLTG